AYHKGLELACDIAPDVPDGLVGDPGRLRQVLMNLVGNAIKFTDRGEVVVEVTRAEEPHAKAPSRKEEEVEQEGIAPAPSSLGGWASLGEVFVPFTVRDPGMGIPADKRDGLFTPFVQVDGSLTRRHGGTGLGLAISRRLAEIMGGTIWFESPAPRQESGVRDQESGIRNQRVGAGSSALTPDSCPLTPDSCSLTPDSCP